MASRQPPERHHPASPEPKPRRRHVRILRARRKVPAARRTQRMKRRRKRSPVHRKKDSRQQRWPFVVHRTRPAHEQAPGAGPGATSVSKLPCAPPGSRPRASRRTIRSTLRKTPATSRSRTANGRSITPRRGCKITSTDAGRIERFRRTASRILRLIRFLSTALPNTLPTVSPTRGLPGSATRSGRPSVPVSGRTVTK